MAGSVNKVILVGNLGQDPEIRTLESGTKVANLSVATSETWNDRQSGERKERTEWHRVVIFNERLADVAERFLRKGRKVYLEGAGETRKYTDQAGQEKYTTEIVCGISAANWFCWTAQAAAKAAARVRAAAIAASVRPFSARRPGQLRATVARPGMRQRAATWRRNPVLARELP